MDRRLTGCGCMAVLLHAALASLAAFQPAGASRTGAFAAASDVELLEAFDAPAPEPERSAPPSSASEPAPARVSVRVASQRAAARVVTSTDAVPAAGSVPEILPEGDPEPPEAGVTEPARGRRLSLAELGLSAGAPTGSPAVMLPPQPDLPSRAAPDVAGLKAALTAHDVALGLGPGGAVASQLRTLAHDLAPLGSQATISVDLASDGSLDALWLEDVTSSEHDWRKVLHAVRQRLGKRSIVSGSGPVRVTLRLTSQSSKRSGPSNGGLDFDVSNIGSPTLHTLHVRVLGQAPL